MKADPDLRLPANMGTQTSMVVVDGSRGWARRWDRWGVDDGAWVRDWGVTADAAVTWGGRRRWSLSATSETRNLRRGEGHNTWSREGGCPSRKMPLHEQLRVLSSMQGIVGGGQRGGYGVGDRKEKDESGRRDSGDCWGGDRNGHGVEKRKIREWAPGRMEWSGDHRGGQGSARRGARCGNDGSGGTVKCGRPRWRLIG
jgi:hypothetical protein